jgi:biotin operon repressor
MARSRAGDETARRPPPVTSRSGRMIFLLQLLHTGGPMTAAALAAAAGVSEQTVRRDIRVAEASGIPVRRADNGRELQAGQAPAPSHAPACYEVPAKYGDQLARSWRQAKLARLLQNGARMTGQQMVEALGIPRNTLVRDVGALRAAGIAVDARAGGAGGYRMPDDMRHLLEGLDTAGVQLLVLGGTPPVPSDRTIVVSWAYAVHHDLPGPLVDQLRRARDLKTRHAAAAEQHASDVAAVWEACRELTGPRASVDQAVAAVSELTARARNERRSGPGHRAQPATADALRHARRRLTAARAALRAAKSSAYPRLQPQFAALAERYRATFSQLRQAAVYGGLDWDTANAVTWQYMIGARQVAHRRQRGLPANLRTRPWDGTGTLTVQLERLTGEAPRSPALLADPGGRYRAQVLLRPWVDPAVWRAMTPLERRQMMVGSLRIRVGSGAHASSVTLPVLVHRMLPADADVARIKVTRQRVGLRYRASVSVLARLPQPARPGVGRNVAVLTCWRDLPDGAVRAAVIAGAGPPPAQLLKSGVVRDHGHWAEAVIPASWREVSATVQQLNARRGRERSRLRAWLRYWMAENPEAAAALDPDGMLAAAIAPAAGGAARAAAEAPGRLAGVVSRLTASPAAGSGEVAARLRRWQQRERRLRHWEANERDQFAARRAHAWCNVAAWVTSGARVVVMDEPPATGQVVEDRGPDGQRAQASRYVVVPSLLRARVTSAARVRGVPAVLTPLPASPPQHACGAPLEPRAAMTAAPGPCPGCGDHLDPDVAALAQLAARAG